MIHTVGPDHLQFWRGDDFEISEFEITNPRTRRPESGKIRFYAKWGDENGEYVGIEPYHLDSLHAVNLAAVGINNPGQAHPSVYGPNSPIPSSATFWMEGVRPGKITLEWRYRKGAEDIRFEQTFLVATEQSKEKWFEELAYMIRLQTDDDPIGQTPMMFAPTRPSAVMPNLVRTWGGDVDVRNEIENAGSYFRKIGEMSEYYDFYEQCWLQNKALDWAGLARRVGNQVVAGISDFEYFLTGAGVVTFLWPDPVLRYGRDEIAAFQKGLMRGGERIFNDIAWQHYAYMRSGYPALEYVNRKSRLAITDEVLLGWKFTERAESHLRVRSLPTAEVDQLLVEAGRRIADYEQNIVISPVYRDLEQILFGQIVELMTTLAPAPVPGGASFDSLMPAGARLSDDVSRWAWITAGLPGAQIQGAGVIHTWSNHGFGAKNDLVKKNLAKGGREFSRVYQAGNLVSIQVWDHHDGEHQ